MSRKAAREKAMQALFQIELTKVDPEEAIKNVVGESELDEQSKAFARSLIIGTLEKLDVIDKKIRENAHKWQLERIGNVEKTALRIAVYEVLYVEDVPNAVAINEAINLVKVFSTEKAAPFVNGILDKIANENRG
ncbi:transcription antitermination factor NusB [Desulfitibacter alkalitolerans]|uniref:transcription antitermination factor NusB n=1 Tax=Desulfitibacter alkalitolerans TaxID=264641 RepID=UPI0004855443|nr:transcription antitermination factor NusB [Desulfitibacter alkalitolerans]